MAKQDDKPADLTADDKFQMLLEVLARQQSGITAEQLSDILSKNALETRKALKPENETHPNISVFHPNGGPYQALPYEVFYNGFPVHKALETHHDRELELLRQVKPGEYRILRVDGSDMTVTVKADQKPTGEITKLRIEFPIAREERHLIPAMQVLLYQLVHTDVPIRERYILATHEHMQLSMPEAATA